MDPIALYCERTAAGLWAEPLNAVSNAGFFIAALVGWGRLRRAGEAGRGRDLRLAVALMVAVGVGSTLWHTVARPWAQAADVAPIFCLMVTLLASALVRLGGRTRGQAGKLVAAFVGVNGVAALVLPRDLLHGTPLYGPTWLALGILAAALRGSRAAGTLWAAFALFSVALVFRTVDVPLCEAWPAGTHFVWHGLNALVLHLMLSALVRRA